jgi:hypothetical protein
VLRLLVISSLPACVIPYALPPLKGELGASAISGQGATGHAGGGTYVASGTLNKDQKFDLGAGAFVDWDEGGVKTKAGYVDAAVFVERSHTTRTSVGVRGEMQWAVVPEAAVTSRPFATMETPSTSTPAPALAVKLRVEHEVFGVMHKGYAGSDKCAAVAGAAHGAGGVGLFAEAGRTVNLPGDRSAWSATAGVTLRIPSTIGVFLGIPGCR